MNPSLVSIKILAFCCVVLFVKMLSIAVFQVRNRSKTGEFTNPVDAKFFAKREPVAIDPVMVIRGTNAFRNDLENIPLFLFLASFYILLGCWETGALIYFSVFTLARIGHTYSFLNGLQPWRTIAFAIGALVNITLCGHILFRIFTM